MSSFQRIILESTESSIGFKSVCDLAPGALPAVNNFRDYLGGVTGGNYAAKLSWQVGAVKATATMTNTAAAVAAETFVLCNVTFTARASGATTNEFNLSATVGTQAANIAAAINASPNLAGMVSATSLAGIVTITAVVPGLIGNAFQFSESLTGVAITAFASGADGTAYVQNLL